MKSLLISLSFILLQVSYVNGQEDEFGKFKRQQEEAFDVFNTQTQQQYQKYLDQIDQEFAAYLRDNWQSFETKEEKVSDKPKPDVFPEHLELPANEVQELPAEEDRLIVEDIIVAPTNYDEEIFDVKTSRRSSSFYGDDTYITIDSKLLSIDGEEIVDPESISDFWLAIASTRYEMTLENVQFYQEKYNLNDYGTYLLVKNIMENLYPDNRNLSRLASWFFMSKMGYKMKLGYNDQWVYPMFPSQNTLYGVTYVKLGDTKYYLLDFDGGSIYTYKEDYAENSVHINFLLKRSINLKEDVETRKLSFDYGGKQYSFLLRYNKNNIAFFEHYPHVSLHTYFGANPGTILEGSVKSEILPAIANMDEVEALSFLLKFVQTAFPYQTDDQQFGHEKVLFPEEFLHYSYSDCEDRSVFFSYLVKVLLGKEVVGVNYPQHVATAVNLSNEIPGKYYHHNGKRFIVCDPTYINAPVGSAMTKFAGADVKLIVQ